MLRDLKKKNKLNDRHLIYINKIDHNIILKNELDDLLDNNVTYVITDQIDTKNQKGFIDEKFLKNNISDYNQKFYVCESPKMTKEIGQILNGLEISTDAVTLDDQ